jgi:hypothetical protein
MSSHGVSSTGRHSSVDELAWAHFDVRLQREFLRARGNAFQSLFVRIMEKAHGSDFHPTRPWGATGDRKCDGYLASVRMVFALYAPKDFENLSRAKTKIRSDHTGALKHWKEFMDGWTLVHNDEDGLAPDLVQLLQRLQAKQQAVTVSQWGLDRLRSTILPLPMEQLHDLFGTVPTARDVTRVRQEDLKQVIDDLAVLIEFRDGSELSAEDLRPVPPGKVEYNRLGASAKELLAVGWRHSGRVRQFFDRHTDPLLGARVVSGFQTRYRQLREAGIVADALFGELQEFAIGTGDRTPRIQIAGLAVLAYLFEACHIFERPPAVKEATGATPNKDTAANAVSPGIRGERPEAVD